MAPARASTRRGHHQGSSSTTRANASNNAHAPAATADDAELFVDPMMGTPLAIYVEKDVQDRDTVCELIAKHGGTVSPGYSSVPYILVDPYKESGQSLWRQYTGKKGKVILNARWVSECVKAGALQTFHDDWAGCKVTGTEKVPSTRPPAEGPSNASPSGSRRQGRQLNPSQADNIPRHLTAQVQHPHQQPMTQHIPPVDPMQAQNTFPYPGVYSSLQPIPRTMQSAGPPQSWQASSAIAPQQTHIAPQAQMMPRQAQQAQFREESWNGGYDHAATPPNAIVGGANPAGYDFRYRDEHAQWVNGSEYTYDPNATYNQSYEQGNSYMDQADPEDVDPAPEAEDEHRRGRRRTRTQAVPAASAQSLVANRRNPPVRSPTPSSRVVKSTYGGNLFTTEDVLYLKKYIDYCQEQGLVLSLREICERIAIKAPHHTFYSWRRYCNKHQIRLGGYTMAPDHSPPPDGGELDPDEEEEDALRAGPGPGTIAAARRQINSSVEMGRTRSPTPPRALFRSTTGKGVAFTDEDIAFLVRFMDYRKSQGRVDMVAFWKDVAAKAPHHSRASWMKYWRRHKHELNHTEDDDPLPAPPEKKMRYSRGDDILLARYFATKPEGTSDKIFQAFARLHPHHPWKGWQEHHRIHKAKIDHFIEQLQRGEALDEREDAAGP